MHAINALRTPSYSVTSAGDQTPPPSTNLPLQSPNRQVQAPTLDNPAALKRAFGDSCNWLALAKKLKDVTQALSEAYPDQALAAPHQQGSGFQADLAARLKNTTIHVCEDSTYFQQHPLTSSSLDAFLAASGLSVPKSIGALIELNNVVAKNAQVHPLGNFSGALAWPVPLSNQDQDSLAAWLQSDSSGLPGVPLAEGAKGVLGHLLSGSAVSESDLKRPSLAIEKLLGSPKAQALGKALQDKLGGIATDTSINDYLLAAIHVGLDPESRGRPAPNSVAGFDLAQRSHWGKPASVVIQALAEHLMVKGRASRQTADLAARLLLARQAPELLVKGVPSSVTYGSLLWTQFAIATAKLEADSPGRVLNMTYSEVLVAAEEIGPGLPGVQVAQRNALTLWAAANGVVDGRDTSSVASEMERIRLAYNNQLSVLTSAATLLQTEIPDRKALALAQLKAAFPEVETHVFEAKTLQKAWLNPGRPGVFPGMRSMMDIVMEGDTLGDKEHWISQDKRIPIQRFCALSESGKLDVSGAFASAYEQSLKALENGHEGLVRYLISTLAPEDRMNFEYGRLEFFHTNDYTMAMDLTTPLALKTRGHTLDVKVTRGGETHIYEIDTRTFSIKNRDYLRSRYTPPYTTGKLEDRTANTVSKTVLFDPFKEEAAQAREKNAPATVPDSLGSERSKYIAKVFAKSLDLHNEDLLNHARGFTSYDQGRARNDAIGEFFLNLIPLRSAIVNFSNGNYAAGLFDLGLDVIGLVTLGAGKAAQASRLLAKGISSLGAVTKAARLLGATAVEAFNPFSGLGDLAKGGARLLAKGAQKGVETVNKLKGASGSYDLLKAASKHYGEAATGSLKIAGQSTENGAVLLKGKWYGFDPDKMRPYGPPLDGFTPRTRAVDGAISPAKIEPSRALSNTQFGNYKVPASSITGLTPDSRGVYVAADGHLSHIRHTDSTGLSAVYEVRQVTRTADGAVQARIYHNNRQTPLLVEHVQGDQWQRLGAQGGGLPSVKSDLGPEIGRGGEGIIYASLDGKSVYKDLGPTRLTTAEGHTDMEVVNLNKYYGEGFAVVMIDEGRKYIKMGRIDGIDLSQIEKGSLPASARSLLDDAFAEMEAKDIFHNDPQLKNFMYSARDNKVFPVDMDGLPAEFMVPGVSDVYYRSKEEARRKFNELLAKAP